MGQIGEPSIAVVGTTIHAAWVQSGVIYHLRRGKDGWSAPIRMASGSSPRQLASADGSLHCVFLNQFTGVSEVYHATWSGKSWSLAINVSRTPGHAFTPAFAAAPDGRLFAAWADTTPGYSVIYYARMLNGSWEAEPVLGARGGHPALAINDVGELHLIWQDRLLDTGYYDIFCAIQKDGTWRTPEIVSDTPRAHSLQPAAAIDSHGRCLIAWQEEGPGCYQIYSSTRVGKAWSTPRLLSPAGVDCRCPKFCTGRGGTLALAWLQGPHLAYLADATLNPAPVSTVSLNDSSVIASDLAIGFAAGGELHALWSGHHESGRQSLLYMSQELQPTHSDHLPLITT
jgi:hypothetical protein